MINKGIYIPQFLFFVCVSVGSLFLDGIAADPGETNGAISQSDWPAWRGPNGNGIADPNQTPPISWNEDKNVIWRTPLPGRGHGSPCLSADRIYLATADMERDIQSVLCINRNDGKQIWESKVHQGGLDTEGNKKQNVRSSLASSTVAADDQCLFINFLNEEAVWTSALDLDGNVLWQKKICEYVVNQGYGSSPLLYKDLVIVSADNQGGGKVVALNRATGDAVWERQRPEKPNYSPPVILTAAGKEQLIMIGCDLVTSLDPTTGMENWEIDGATTECVISTVTDGKHIFTSGGFPKNHISAVAADGSGKLIWEKNTRVYVPSILYRDGHLYAVLDAGIAACFRCDDGREVWKSRLGGDFYSSPIMVDDLIYATNEDGVTYIFKAQSDKFESVAQNKLGESVYSTPAICDGRIYHRIAHQIGDSQQEYLYCLGDKEE